MAFSGLVINQIRPDRLLFACLSIVVTFEQQMAEVSLIEKDFLALFLLL